MKKLMEVRLIMEYSVKEPVEVLKMVDEKDESGQLTGNQVATKETEMQDVKKRDVKYSCIDPEKIDCVFAHQEKCTGIEYLGTTMMIEESYNAFTKRLKDDFDFTITRVVTV